MTMTMSLSLRRLAAVAALAVPVALAAFLPAEARADRLADIRKAGVINIAVFDSNPPFSTIDPKTHKLVGYDIDFADAIAEKLGVKPRLIATNPANRIPLLQSGKADLIVADITITPERAKVIDFSTPYFVTGQKFLVPADAADTLDAYATSRIGAVKGTTGEQEIKARFPKARVLSYDDIPSAFTALRQGNVQAITQDSTILAGLLAGAPDGSKYKILAEPLSREDIGVGVPKSAPELLAAVNDILVELEKDGTAAQIYDRWFGKGSKTPEERNFTIVKP